MLLVWGLALKRVLINDDPKCVNMAASVNYQADKPVKLGEVLRFALGDTRAKRMRSGEGARFNRQRRVDLHLRVTKAPSATAVNVLRRTRLQPYMICIQFEPT
jgi:hypothetical protein